MSKGKIMRFFRIINLILFLCFSSSVIANDIIGFWRTTNPKKPEESSIVAIYSYQGKYFGRIVAIYNGQGELVETIYKPIKKATALVGDPYYCGLDIVMDVTLKENGTYRGYIMDPRDGEIYKAGLWRKNQDLIVRGKLFIFGQSYTWTPFSEKNFSINFIKPDISTFVPKKTTVKD